MIPGAVFGRRQCARERAARAAQAALHAASAAGRAPEPSAQERRVLAAVLAAAWQRCGGGKWQVSYLVDLGVVDPADSRSVGRLLARSAHQVVDGFELVPEGEYRKCLRWRVRVLR